MTKQGLHAELKGGAMLQWQRSHTIMLCFSMYKGKKKTNKYFYDSWDSQPGCPQIWVSC